MAAHCQRAGRGLLASAAPVVAETATLRLAAERVASLEGAVAALHARATRISTAVADSLDDALHAYTAATLVAPPGHTPLERSAALRPMTDLVAELCLILLPLPPASPSFDALLLARLRRAAEEEFPFPGPARTLLEAAARPIRNCWLAVACGDQEATAAALEGLNPEFGDSVLDAVATSAQRCGWALSVLNKMDRVAAARASSCLFSSRNAAITGPHDEDGLVPVDVSLREEVEKPILELHSEVHRVLLPQLWKKLGPALQFLRQFALLGDIRFADALASALRRRESSFPHPNTSLYSWLRRRLMVCVEEALRATEYTVDSLLETLVILPPARPSSPSLLFVDLSLAFETKFPCDIFFDSSAIESYSAIFSSNLELALARSALREFLPTSMGRVPCTSLWEQFHRQLHAFRLLACSVTSSLTAYTYTVALHSVWGGRVNAMREARDLCTMRDCHSSALLSTRRAVFHDDAIRKSIRAVLRPVVELASFLRLDSPDALRWTTCVEQTREELRVRIVQLYAAVRHDSMMHGDDLLEFLSSGGSSALIG